MNKIRIQDFGPIAEGLNFKAQDNFLEISRLTVLLGTQGSGKSTIAKLISTFLWLEKALVRGDFEPSSIDYDSFVNKYLAYHNIESYIKSESEIEFIGAAYSFCIKNRGIHIEKRNRSVYIRPKISYISSERSFLTALPNVSLITDLLHSLFDLLGDFDEALNGLNGTKIDLPVDTYQLRYDNSNGKPFISEKNKDYEIELNQAASGIQSLTPLSIITHYFSKKILYTADTKRQQLSLEQQKRVKKEVDVILSTVGLLSLGGVASLLLANPFLAAVLMSAGITFSGLAQTSKTKVSRKQEEAVMQIEKALYSLVNSCFINIVEEPEQNLYPNSQKNIIEYLLKYANQNNNKLVLTTHSPYVLGTVNNCLYAGNLNKKGYNAESIISKEIFLTSEEVRSYFIEDGRIKNVFETELEQIDHDIIDSCSDSINSDYNSLSSMEFEHSAICAPDKKFEKT